MILTPPMTRHRYRIFRVIAKDLLCKITGRVIAPQHCTNCLRRGPVVIKRGEFVGQRACPRCKSKNTVAINAPITVKPNRIEPFNTNRYL